MKSLLFGAFTRTLVAKACRCRALSSCNGTSPLKRLVEEASSFGDAEESEPELRWATQPYARAASQRTSPVVDPRETAVLLFPGQGAQYVGMGKKLLELPSARDLYELASSIVGWDVARVCTEGPEEELQRRCQVCVLVTSLAALELARDERAGAVQRVRAAAGFSLGEIGALVFAEALSFEHALRLTELRAAAMEAAAAEREGGMLTLWLAPDARLGEAMWRAREHAAARGVAQPVCAVANYLHPGCKVVAGDAAALRWLETEGRAWGVRRSARVRVAGAFHTVLMARAAEAVRAGLQHVAVAEPRVRVVSCVTARTCSGAAGVRRALERLTCSPVRWEQTLQALYARPRAAPQPLTLTLGPGGALRSSLRLVNARAWDASLQIPA
ncbi:probable malonyl-CoA-acyl carrier protein transacylase, mitochondrial [Battus philenor]|uniref:probable malonyl-CoA-acyl carrier protein transacylase, mitochondrial n=1 Tax=Battus philenor TaxID=42288 RepID=UPI0035CFA073